MTVAELIAALQAMPHDARVIVYDDETKFAEDVLLHPCCWADAAEQYHFGAKHFYIRECEMFPAPEGVEVFAAVEIT